jgi:hypothetical protein
MNTWEFVVDHLGRPTTTNRAHQMHHRQVSADRKEWRNAGFVLGRAQKVTRCNAITVEAWGRYPNRRSLPDPDGIAPAVKGVLDGLVDAGVVADDSGEFVHAITYRAPVVGAGQPAALIVRITPQENP